jgi:ATP-dependent helicase/nuclease subunit A
VHQLILFVLKITGYGDLARAMPDGEQRSANLHMLVEKAMDYEKTSYRGLFNFIRYIENLQKYEVDFGEVNLSGAGSSSVQIMTIHKSKGLEFPIVFAAGMGKQFNFQDINARLLLHADLGFGADVILPKKRMTISTLHKQIIRRELLKESLGEELRVLYVALTRAKEKLILTGTIGNLEKQLHSLSRYLDSTEELLPIGTRMKGKNYWSYVLPALARHRCMDELFEEYGIMGARWNPIHDSAAEFVVEKITAFDLTEEEVLTQVDARLQEEILKNWDCDRVYDAEIRSSLEARFTYVYPFAYLKEIPAKVTVSDLKKRSYVSQSEKEESILPGAELEVELEPLIPRFVAEKEEEFTGSSRGTAYHRVMECLDYSRTASLEAVKQQLEELKEQKKLTEAEAACIDPMDVWQFVSSPLGVRMGSAAREGKLFREQPFVMSVPAATLDEHFSGDETVLVQGIIDAYFLEGEELVLVDYKTDKVTSARRLVELYHVQLEDYAAALKRMLQKNVKETYLYSFTLKKMIRL